MTKPNGGRKITAVLIAIGILWGAVALFSHFDQLLISARRISSKRMLVVLLLSGVNYWIRIIRFNWFTKRVAVQPIKKDLNSLIFFTGLSMNLTPARAGELVKAYFQHQFFGESFARMAPIVLIERLTDALAMLVMMSIGVLAFKIGLSMFAVLMILTLVVVLILHQKSLLDKLIKIAENIPLLKKICAPTKRITEASYKLTGWLPLIFGTSLGVLAWSAQAAGLWLLAQTFGAAASLKNLYFSLFTFSSAAAAGFISILPGGLGVNEISTIGLLQRLLNLSSSDAIVTTFAFRLATLWFGILLGVVSLIYLEKMRSPEKSADIS